MQNNNLLYFYTESKDSLNTNICIICNKNSDVRFKSQVFKNSNLKTEQTIKVEPINSNYQLNDYFIVPFIVGFVFLSLIILRYRKFLHAIVESLGFQFIAQKISSDINVPFRRLFFNLDTITIISYSLFVLGIIKLYDITILSEHNFFIPLAVFLVMFFLYRVFFGLFHIIVRYFTVKSSFIQALKYNMLLFSRLYGIILLPLSFVLVYSNVKVAMVVLYVSISMLILTLFYRLYRVSMMFIKERVSLLYIILYFCALEIVPFLVLYKEISEHLFI